MCFEDEAQTDTYDRERTKKDVRKVYRFILCSQNQVSGS